MTQLLTVSVDAVNTMGDAHDKQADVIKNTVLINQDIAESIRNENQQFNYKMSDYTVGNNSVGYYSSGSHTNLTIQNLDNNVYQNDYLVITQVSIPSSEENSILEYAPELLNKVFSN